MIQRWQSGRAWETQVGYARVVRAGANVYVAGTTATTATGEIVGIDDPYRQTVQALENIRWALTQVGAQLSDVVRTRMYVVNIEDWGAIAQAHHEYFAEICPAATMVEVQRLIDPAMLIEIEVDAWIAS